MMELVLILLIVAAAAYGLYRMLRRPQGNDSCAGCPLKDKCTDRKQKKSSNTCTGKK